MTDDLVLSGGGWIGVATADQLDRVLSLERFSDALREAADVLGAVSGSLTVAQLQAAEAPTIAYAVARELESAVSELTTIADHAGLIARLTRTAMLVYGDVEHAQNRAIHSLADQVGHFVGSHLPFVFVAAAPIVFPAVEGAVAGTALTMAVTGTSPGELADDLARWLKHHPQMLNNETVADSIELVTGAVDDALMGFAQAPLASPTILGDSGLGISGVDTAADAFVLAGSGLGLLRESAISVSTTLTKNIASDKLTYAERIARIPDAASRDGAQIRIDKYFANGRLIGCDVYLSGTQAWDIRGTSTPFDLTSNVRATGNVPNGSLAAVEAAMDRAGISSSTPITVTGHSQGGILAHEIAAAGKYNVVAVLEAGAPAVHTPLPKGTPEVDLVHNEDIVPSLGGARDDNDTLVVGGTAYREDNHKQSDNIVSAHDVDRYVRTAAVLDTVSDPRVTAAAAALASTSVGATTITSTYYKAERVTGR